MRSTHHLYLLPRAERVAALRKMRAAVMARHAPADLALLYVNWVDHERDLATVTVDEIRDALFQHVRACCRRAKVAASDVFVRPTAGLRLVLSPTTTNPATT